MDWCWEGHERTGFILDTLTPTSENIFSGFIVFVSQIMIVNIYKHLLINHSCNVVEVSPKGFFAQKIQSGFLDQCQKEGKRCMNWSNRNYFDSYFKNENVEILRIKNKREKIILHFRSALFKNKTWLVVEVVVIKKTKKKNKRD